MWFNEADPISILVLATNAHDCYHALGKKIGKPSFYGEWLATMPESMQRRAKYIQDFAKHGFMDIEEDAPFDEQVAAGLMTASILSHEEIYGADTKTGLMRLFTVRCYFEHPEWTLPHVRPHFEHGATIHNLGSGSRKEFFDQCQPLLARYS